MEKNTDEIIKKINQLYEEEVMDDFDVIYSLGIHENNHSKLLRALLCHKKNVLLESFVKDVLKIQHVEFCSNVEIFALKDNIDLLIKDEQYAIIIENKIYWAKDQYNQILKYVKNVAEKNKINENNIYAIYLTSDGKKKISNLGDEKDEIQLKEMEEKGRFIQINYKEHIIPWLEEKNNKILNSNSDIKRYISFLMDYVIVKKEYRIFEIICKKLIQCHEFEFKTYLKMYHDDKDNEKSKQNLNAFSFFRWLLNNKLYDNLASLFSGFENDKPWFRKDKNELYILFFKTEWGTKWFIHFQWILDVHTIELRLELHFEQRGKNTNVGKTAKYLEQNLKGLITGSGREKVYYTKRIPLNNDLSIDENGVKDDIQKITKMIDEQLINKQ